MAQELEILPSQAANNTATVKRLIAESIRTIEPEADVILFGSRARSNAGSDADWDVLIIVPSPPSYRMRQRIAAVLLPIELQCETAIVPMIVQKNEWQSPVQQATALCMAIQHEGVRL
jgi:predicted nucleotidyltransferase